MIRFAEALLREAEYRVETAQGALRRRRYSYCLRQSQEAVELSLKAALRLKGIEYPKYHDVGDVLLRSSELFPRSFSRQIPVFAEISTKLAEQREASMYGFEELGRSDELVSKTSATAANAGARRVFRACRALLKRKARR